MFYIGNSHAKIGIKYPIEIRDGKFYCKHPPFITMNGVDHKKIGIREIFSLESKSIFRKSLVNRTSRFSSEEIDILYRNRKNVLERIITLESCLIFEIPQEEYEVENILREVTTRKEIKNIGKKLRVNAAKPKRKAAKKRKIAKKMLNKIAKDKKIIVRGKPSEQIIVKPIKKKW